jgi:signal transduction histidine kinase
VLAVSDTGPGLSQEFIKNSLFVPFRTTKRGGWGIGLYQAKGIVDAHRGTIEVTSTEGQGCTFLVKIPVGAGKGEVERT